MSADNPLPSPWQEFLAEIDGMLNESLVQILQEFPYLTEQDIRAYLA